MTYYYDSSYSRFWNNHARSAIDDFTYAIGFCDWYSIVKHSKIRQTLMGTLLTLKHSHNNNITVWAFGWVNRYVLRCTKVYSGKKEICCDTAACYQYGSN